MEATVIAGVVIIVGDWDCVAFAAADAGGSIALARPKSSTFTVPSGRTLMLALGIIRNGRQQGLDRDFAPELRVARPIDRPHAALTERRQDLVGTEARAGHQGHGKAATVTA